MARPVTLFTGQWADLTLEDLCKKASAWGYDGLELACWGDHVEVERAAKDKQYAKSRKEMLADYGLKCWAISNHLAGQLVCDPNDDERSDMFAPKDCHGDAEKKRKWAIKEMKLTAKAAQNIGVKVVCGFTGSSIWHMLYSFPPVSDKMIDDGFKRFAKLCLRPAYGETCTGCGEESEGVRLQLRPESPALAIRGARQIPAGISQEDLPCAHEGCGHDARR
jgi:sugar phosphate isomerase/epimerase